jgi:hypothetical protein
MTNFLSFCFGMLSAQSSIKKDDALYIVCKTDNDLFKVLLKNKQRVIHYKTQEEAVNKAPHGAAVLILADDYPEKLTIFSKMLLDEVISKNIRLYIEYPSSLPELETGNPRAANFERLVVANDFFGKDLPKMQILAVNGLNFTPVKVKNPMLAAARVAGFDNAVFGLPEESDAILFQYPKGNILVSTTKLSHFITGRYGPQKSWKILWQKILEYLLPNKVINLDWAPMVTAAYRPNDVLPKDVEKQAFKRAADWFINSKLLLHPSRVLEFKDTVAKDKSIWPPSPNDAPIGDGTLGILEAPLSIIRLDGSQMQSLSIRGDCQGESAMALAFGGKIFNDIKKKNIAANLLDFWYFKSDAGKKERGDSNHGAFGLMSWGTINPAWYTANYGDDNARLLMGTLAASSLLNNSAWDEMVMRCLLANLRTSGKNGFRDDRIDLPQLTEKGWKYYFERDFVSYSPHMESYLWACYLWAYDKTGYELFYTRAEKAIRMTMAVYTDGWRWTNGLAQEIARMILPLAWLVRVKDTPEHREWLKKAVDGLLALQQPCGAIREELGLPGKGMFPPPESNSNYGEHEAPLIQENGDPVSDLLYTTNFALLGLHEAAFATNDKSLKDAEDKLVEFLCRIQIHSPSQPALDGGWFRAFDFKRWEAWASNADAGWGTWAIESGWTQAWITSVLGMRQMNTSLWDLTANSKINRYFEKYKKMMMEE